MTTRHDQRAKCLEAMEAAYLKCEWRSGRVVTKTECITAAFDSLHGLARVCAVDETTEEMVKWCRSKLLNHDIETFYRMSAAGDLTNAPEKP